MLIDGFLFVWDQILSYAKNKRLKKRKKITNCRFSYISEMLVGLDRLGRPVQNRPAREGEKAHGRIEPG